MPIVRTTHVGPQIAASSIASMTIVGYRRRTPLAIAENLLDLRLENLLHRNLEILYFSVRQVRVATKSRKVTRMGMGERSKRQIFRNGFRMGRYRLSPSV